MKKRIILTFIAAVLMAFSSFSQKLFYTVSDLLAKPQDKFVRFSYNNYQNHQILVGIDTLGKYFSEKYPATNNFTLAEKTKLAGIATGATVNSTDAFLLSRANHTGVQAISTISGLQTTLDNKVNIVAGKGLSTNDYTTTEQTKLAGIATGATANSTDAFLLSRANHTGVQAISTVTGLQTALDGKASLQGATFQNNLTVKGIIKTSTATAGLQIADRTDTTKYWEMFSQGSQKLRLRKSDNTEILAIDNSGNMGLGTLSPVDGIHLYRAGLSRLNVQSVGDFNTGFRLFRTLGTNNTDWEIYSPSSSTSLRFYNGSDLFSFTNTGNLGIGITAPTDKLSVIGAIRATQDGAGVGLYFVGGIRHTGSQPFYIDGNSTSSAGNILFRNGSGYTEQMRLDPNGRLGVGTPNPTAQIHVLGSTSGYLATGTSSNRALLVSSVNSLYGLHMGVNSSGESWIQSGRADNTTKYNLILQHEGGFVGINTTLPTSPLHVNNLPVYSGNAAAITGGLTAGAFYRTSTGTLMVVY